jgi:mono/diheme cytochrome c family protein
VQANNPGTMLHMILDGARIASTAGNPTGLAMPAFGWKLSDQDVADLASYLRATWGNQAGPVSTSDVKSARERIAKSVNAAAGR